MNCLVVGHITHDIIVRGSKKIERAGGGAYYSALALSKFCNVVVLTKVGGSFPIIGEEHNIQTTLYKRK